MYRPIHCLLYPIYQKQPSKGFFSNGYSQTFLKISRRHLRRSVILVSKVAGFKRSQPAFT